MRETPVGWHRTYTVEETITFLGTRQVEELSLDNDLGEGFLEGYKVVDFLEEAVYNDITYLIPVITIHSSNAARVEYMEQAVANIHRIREQQLKDTNASR